MSNSIVLLRTVVLVAFVTLVAWVVSGLQRNEESLDATARRLEAATASRELPAPVFGRVLRDVHSAEDAVQTPSGWVVLDARAEQLVFLDNTGALLSRVGRRGEGPGELMRATHVARLDSTVVVAEATGTRLDLFSFGGTFLRRLALDSRGCASASLRGLVSGAAEVITLRLCSRPNGETSVLLERLGPGGEQVFLSEQPLRDLRSGRIDPTRMPLIARVADRLYFGVTPDPCVQEITAGGEAAYAYCHPDPHPVPLPDSLREELRELAPRFDALGASMVVPERYPPFEDIMSMGGQLAFHTLLDADARALDVVRGDGLERILLPAEARVFVGATGLLLARDEVEGTAFAVLPLP